MGVPRLLTLLLATMLQLPQPARAEPAELRGVWLTANDMPVLRDRTRMQATLDQLHFYLPSISAIYFPLARSNPSCS